MFRQLSKRLFHGGGIVAMGRKTGATALEPAPRSLSKKQKKRKVRRLEARELKVDPKKEKIREEHLKEQMESPQVKEFIEKTEETMLKAVRELMLPDGMDPESGSNVPKLPRVQPIDVLKTLRKEAKASKNNQSLLSALLPLESKELVPSEKEIVPGISFGNASYAAVHFAKRSELDKVDEILQLMKRLDAKPDCKVYTTIMGALSRNSKFDKAISYFDRMIKEGVEPNSWAWSALVHAKAKKDGPEAALQTIDQLKKMGAPLTSAMFTSVLQAYIGKHRNDEAHELWMRMHEEEIEISREAFTVMLRYCANTGQAERAFFFMDEMRLRKLEPDAQTFLQLFRACAEAPHWVDGYHDIIFDAMSAMEGAEIKPTAEIYNTIIYAFARAGDPVAAEYYYWEMKGKGLAQDLVTHNNLLFAYAKSQSVGLRHYGSRGRYVKPPERQPTEDEQAYMDAGATKVAEMMSKGLFQEVDLERGSRQKRRMEDLLDDDPEAVEAFDAEVRQEAAANRARRLGYSGAGDDANKFRALGTGDDDDVEEVDFAALAEDDEELRRLMAELEMEDDVLEAELEDETRAAGKQSSKKSGDSRKTANNRATAADDVDIDKLGRFRERGEITMVDGVKYERVTVEDIESLTAKLMEEERHQGSGNDEELIIDAAMKRAAARLSSRDAIDALIEGGDEDFADPFEDMRTSNRRQDSLRGNARVLTDLLDGEGGGELPSNRKDNVPVPSAGGGRNKNSGAIVDTGIDVDGDDVDENLVSLETIAEQWDMVEFGRAPPPDYSIDVKERQQINIARARKAFRHMQLSGIAPDVVTLTSYMSVFAEAQCCDDALKIFRSFETFGLSPNSNTYRVLIKMHIREKDIDKAVAVKEDMLNSSIVPDSESYGLLIESYTHREKIVEGLQLLEEATAKKIKIPERHIKYLRARCEKLGITHPDMPEHPNRWIKDAKNMRRAGKRSSNRKVEPLRSALYG